MADTKTKILLTRRLLQKDIDYISNGLTKRGLNEFVIIDPKDYSERKILSLCEDIEIILGPYITKEIVKKASKLKLIQIPWTGLDTFDFSSVKNFEGKVCNSHSNATAVSEFAVALTLDLVKKIAYHDALMRKGDWNRNQKDQTLDSLSISDSKIGIMGYGSIGRKVGKLFHSFGADIYTLNNQLNEFEEVTKVFDSNSLIDFCNQVDIIICCLPLTKETEKLFDRSILSEITSKPYIVNVSRAEIFEEKHLYQSLLNGNIRGYASDVWSSDKAAIFSEMNNTILSPHRAGYITKGLPHLDDTIVNLSNYLNGEELINVVDISKQY